MPLANTQHSYKLAPLTILGRSTSTAFNKQTSGNYNRTKQNEKTLTSEVQIH